jgi:hypothetical protein
MALEVSMTGSGTIGPIAPGWTVNEYITPVAIGDTGSGTGSVSFSARSTEDSLLVINNDVDSNPNGLGVVSGVVQSVSETGITASVTHGTFLDKFNLDVVVPPIEAGGPRAWFYKLGEAVFGEGYSEGRPDYSIPTPASSSSTQQYSYCFPFDNNGTDLTGLYSIDSLFTNSIKSTDGSFGYSFGATSLPDWNGFSSPTPMLPGIQTAGNFYQTQPELLPDLWAGFEPYIEFMVDVDAATDIRLWLKSGTVDGSPSYSNTVSLKVDGAASTVAVTNVTDDTTTTGNFSALINGDPLLFSFYHLKNSPAQVAFNRFHYKVTNSAGSTITGFVNCFLSGILNFAGDYINCSKMRYLNVAYVISYTPTYQVPEVEAYLFNIDFTGYTEGYIGPYPSCAGVAWELMQQLAAAENFEIAIYGNTVYVRDVGLTAYDITNVAASPTINPASTLSGRQINIPYSEAYFVNGVVYDARADGNNIISVEAGQSTIALVKYDVHPISLNQPTRYLATGTGAGAVFTGPLPDGKYFVVDSTGLPISENQWEDYGGDLSVAIDSEDPSAIEITVTGPYVEIPSTTGPYSISATDGENEYAALSIVGTGVYSGDSVLGLITGVDPIKYTRAAVNTITNPFIVTEENAYDRGVWAAQKASGPVVTLSASVPTSSLTSIGLTCGSLIAYRDNTYRITSVSIGTSSSTINAERYVTVNDVDSLWGVARTGNIEPDGPYPFTISIASPAVVTVTGASPSHNFTWGNFVSFRTTGKLPNNAATSSTLWGGWVINPTATTFQLSATPVDSATIPIVPINTSGTQSGSHTIVSGMYSVLQYDATWENYECQDQIVFPYKNIGYPYPVGVV